jgi:hypothetical protein
MYCLFKHYNYCPSVTPILFPPKQRVVGETVKTKMFPLGEATLGELSTLIHIENSAQKCIQ